MTSHGTLPEAAALLPGHGSTAGPFARALWFFSRSWAGVAALGTRSAPSPLVKRIRIVNQYAAAIGLLCSPYLVVFPLLGATVLGGMIVPTVLAYALVLTLNAHGRHDAARVLAMVVGNTVIFAYAASLGMAAQVQTMLLATACLPWVFYEPRTGRAAKVFGTVYPVVLWGLLLADAASFIPKTEVTPAAAALLPWVLVPTSFCVLIALVMVLYVENFRAESSLATALAQLQSESRERARLARVAGMAEVATDVLHDVGNALNSVAIACGAGRSLLEESSHRQVRKLADLLTSQGSGLGAFLTTDPKGARVPEFLGLVATQLEREYLALEHESAEVSKGIEHIGIIVRRQQELAVHPVVLEDTTLGELVERAVAISQPTLQEHRTTLVHEGPRGAACRTDPHHVVGILANLLRNAAEAMTATAEPRTVVVRVEVETATVAISVVDRGSGVAPEDQARLFTHGFTTKASGHGFGLHGSALRARLLGGSLTAHSEGPGTGASFILTFPRGLPTEVSAAAA